MARAWTRGQAELRGGRAGAAQCVPRAWATAVGTSTSLAPPQSDKAPNPNDGVRGSEAEAKAGNRALGERRAPSRTQTRASHGPTGASLSGSTARRPNGQTCRGDVSPARGQGRPLDPARPRPCRQATREAKARCSPRSKTHRSPREDQRRDEDPEVYGGPTCGRGRPPRLVSNEPDDVRHVDPRVTFFLVGLTGPSRGRTIVTSSLLAQDEPDRKSTRLNSSH